MPLATARTMSAMLTINCGVSRYLPVSESVQSAIRNWAPAACAMLITFNHTRPKKPGFLNILRPGLPGLPTWRLALAVQTHAKRILSIDQVIENIMNIFRIGLRRFPTRLQTQSKSLFGLVMFPCLLCGVDPARGRVCRVRAGSCGRGRSQGDSRPISKVKKNVELFVEENTRNKRIG